MKPTHLFPWLLLLPVAFVRAQIPRTDPQLNKIVGEVRAEVNPNEAMVFMRRIYENDRWFTFSRFKETAEYVQKTMNDIGMRSIEMEGTPADGETQFGFWTMPMAWDVKQAVLEIVEPTVPPEMRVLANYQQIPTSLGRWSGPTPPGGITCDVVELRSGRKGLNGIDVKGKMVLVEHRAGLKVELYNRGAAGMISFDTENPELVDGHLWINSWGDNGWAFTKTSKPLVAFSITPRQGAYLRDLLNRYGHVRVRALVDSRYYSGSHFYTTGIVQGSGSDEEVLELGHTNEQGANDNAAGVAAMLESIATLNRLIEAGKLPRPRRSIRVLAMAEMYGSMPYMVKYSERLKRTIGSICIDTPAAPYEEAGTEYKFQLNPDISRSYQDALILRVGDNYYADMKYHFSNWLPYRTGTDVLQVDPMMGGIPTVKPEGGWGRLYTHHNSADTPDRVDPHTLRDLTSMLAAYVYYLASAGEAEIPWLAEITVNRGYENILRASQPSLDRIAVARDVEALASALYWANAEIGQSSDRDQEAVLSTLRLAQPERREKIRGSLDPLLKDLRRFAQDQSERLQQAADYRARELGASVPVKATAPPLDPRRAEASQIIVKRKRIGSITLDDLSPDQREGYPAGSFNVPLITALYWCDGNRRLDEVIRLTELEHGPMDFDFVGYFKFLARHGYVDIFPAPKR